MATTRWPILLMESPFKASPNSSIRGTDCAGALPTVSTAISLREIRSNTRHNTTATARWERSAEEEAHKDTVDPEAWAIVDGKLYLAHSRHWIEVWRENAKEHIRQADRDWEAVKGLPAPEIVGPPCAASPPTTKVALRDGGHLVVIGGQVARDEVGNVVGKGDLQAQIEQVGKNVGACLNASGARVKDIIFTVSHVTRLAEFDKYADLRQRYFGPPSPRSTMVTVPQLADPDFLVQVEAFAKIQ